MARKAQSDMQTFFHSLGDATRLRLLNLMAEQEVCVCYLVQILGGPQPKVSRHLAYLRSAGIVAARRDGRWMHYRVVPPTHDGAAQILRTTINWMEGDKAMRADRARLKKASCAPARYALAGAPVPVPVTGCGDCA